GRGPASARGGRRRGGRADARRRLRQLPVDPERAAHRDHPPHAAAALDPLRGQRRRPRRPARARLRAGAPPRRRDRPVDRARLPGRAPGLRGHLRGRHELPPRRGRPPRRGEPGETASVKLSPGRAGAAAGPAAHEVDAGWLRAYAAALGDTAPESLDPTRPAGIVGHPLFPVCYEWPLALDLRARTLTDEVAVRGVHATHDLRIHRRARSGDRLSTRAVVVSVEPTPPGALVVTRFTTVDADGQPVSTTDYGSIYRGVECAGAASGGARPRPAPSAAPAGVAPPPAWTAEVSVPATLAHVYTECARIWNPIHTD